MPTNYNLKRSAKVNAIDDIIGIQADSPIEELSNETCDYYFTEDKDGNSVDYFAVAMKMPLFSNMQTAFKLSNLPQEEELHGINKPLEAAIVEIKNLKKSLPVFIIKAYHPQNNLKELILNNKPLSKEVIEHILLPSLLEVLEFCEKNNLYCGNISPENIIILEDEDSNPSFLLKETFTNLPGKNNSEYFFSTNLEHCPEFAKYGTLRNDLYSLGLTIYFALTGKDPWDGYTLQEYNTVRLQKGVFSLLSNNLTQSSGNKLYTIIQLLVNNSVNKPTDTLSDIKKILNATDYEENETLEVQAKETDTIFFNTTPCTSPEYLAGKMHANWDSAKTFLKDDILLKWFIKISRKDLFDHISKILEEDKSYDLILSKVLNTLDPNGPLRFKNFAIYPGAVPNAITYLSIKKEADAYQEINRIIDIIISIDEFKIAVDWQIKDIFLRLKESYSSNSLSKKQNRVVYMTNPFLHCLSENVISKYIVTYQQLISLLEETCHNSKKLNIDQHIIAFLDEKLSFTPEKDFDAKIHTNYYKIHSSLSVQFCLLLNAAHAKSPNIQIKTLCNLLKNEIVSILEENLYDINIKSKIKSSIMSASSPEVLTVMTNVLLNAKMYRNDFQGYKKAMKEIIDINAQIKNLGDVDYAIADRVFWGQRITVIFSYLVCLIVSLIMIL